MIHSALTVVTAPAETPVTVDEAKLHLRVDSDVTEDDGLILAKIQAATAAAERETGQAFITRTLRASYDAFPYTSRSYLTHREAFIAAGGRQGIITLPSPPLQSVTSITYTDTAGASQTLSASGYQVDTESRPGRIFPAYASFWPTTRLETPNAVQITYLAGWGEPDDVPDEVKEAILLILGQIYYSRGDSPVVVPDAAQWLLRGNWIGAM